MGHEALAGVLLISVLRLQSLGFTVVRALLLPGRIAGVIATEKWLVVGFGRGTILEASFGSKLLPVDLEIIGISYADGT